MSLTVVPGEDKATGEVSIDIDVDGAQPILWLHAVSMSVLHADIDVPGTRVRHFTGDDQFLGVAFDPPLAAGPHRLTLQYVAGQNRNSSRGIFTLEDAGTWYSMTQFEPMAARQAFPCFDEPGFKTPWQVSLRVPRAMQAVSNAPIESETDAPDGLKWVKFAETEPLPTYLVAFAVGNWQLVDLGRAGLRGTPLRLIAPRGRRADLAFARRSFPELFKQEERWFGIGYPFAKLDQIAIPLTVRFAMENAGLITYGSTILLSSGAETPAFRHIAANIGAHEMAHQWFGNLVTTKWWDDIWLNEAFATWFAEKMVDQWHPDYERGVQRVHQRADAIDEDSLASARRIREPITSRGEIFNAFDSITYQKGATVIGMFEGWVGEAPFRRGVRAYLQQHRYGSATVHDFLDALSSETGVPVGPAFSTFLDQNGVPEVSVALQCTTGGASLSLAQRRHVPSGSDAASPPSATQQRWQIPVCVRYGSGSKSSRTCTLLSDPSATLSLGRGCPAYVFANAGGAGYYIPDYSADLMSRLNGHRSALGSAEMASLLYDIRALVAAGSMTGADALTWVRQSAQSNDRHVTIAAIALATFVRDRLLEDGERQRFSGYVRKVFGPRARALGFASRRGERDDDQLLRRTLLRFAGPEDPALGAEARRRTLAWIKNRKTLDPGLVDAVLATAARNGDAALFDAMDAEARSTTDRLDRRNLLMALFLFENQVLGKRAMQLLLDPALDIRESMTALNISQSMAPTHTSAYEFIMTNFDALAARVDADAPGGWPWYAAGLCGASDRAAVEAFWHGRIARYPGIQRNLDQALESIELCTRLRAKAGQGVGEFLADY